MARILLVEPARKRSVAIAHLLRRIGHGTVAVSSVSDGLARFAERLPDLVIVAADSSPGAPAELVTAAREHRVPVVCLGSVELANEAPEPDATLSYPLSVPALAATLGTLLPARPPGWSGSAFLSKIDGPLDAFPPLRVAFLAHRLRADGTLHVDPGRDEAPFSVTFAGGRIADCRGIADLLAPPPATRSEGRPTAGIGPSNDDLQAVLGRVIAEGMRPDAAMDRAAEGVGRALARTVGRTLGRVRFTPGEVEGRVLALPLPVTQALVRGLASIRPASHLRRVLGAMRRHQVRVNLPDDSPETSWGLSPLALRLLHDAVEVPLVVELLGDDALTTEGKGDDRLLAFDLIQQFGLVYLDDPPAGKVAADPALDDPRVRALREALADLERKTPLEILSVERSDQATPEGVEQAFRAASARFHPDRFTGAPAEVRKLAEACFSRVAEARSYLLEGDKLDTVRQRLAAAEAGKVFVTAEERRAAKVELTRGQTLFRQRRWQAALAAFERAIALDPEPWIPRFLAIQARWRLKQISAEEAVAEMLELPAPKGAARADVIFVAGETLMADGEEDQAYKLYRQAVKEWPEHVGAQRRLRLKEMRERKEQEKGLGRWRKRRS